MALIRHSVDAVHRLQEDRGVSLEVDLELDEAPIVGDTDRLEQVIINLLDNAGKFADDETPKVRLHLTRHEQCFRMSVEDNGPGIGPEERERVFEKFHQIKRYGGASGKARGRPRGSGLGLPISRGIISHLGGRLWVDDAPTLKGACLVMELPVAAAETKPEETQGSA